MLTAWYRPTINFGGSRVNSCINTASKRAEHNLFFCASGLSRRPRWMVGQLLLVFCVFLFKLVYVLRARSVLGGPALFSPAYLIPS